MKILKYITFLILLTPFALMSQNNESSPKTLQECIDLAMTNNLSILKSKLGSEIQRKENKLNLAKYLPQVNGSFSYVNDIKIPVTAVEPDELGQTGTQLQFIAFGINYTSSLNANASILISAELLTDLTSAKINEQIAELIENQTSVNVQSTVKSLYYTLLVYNKLMEESKLIVDNVNKEKQIMQTGFKSGLLSAIDAKQMDIVALRTEAQYQELVNAKKVIVETLANVIGLEEGESLSVESTIDEVYSFLQDASGLDIKFAPQNTFAYKASLLEQNLIKNDLEEAKLSFIPTLSVLANYQELYQGRQASTVFSNGFPNYNVGVSVNIPIFEGAARQKNLQLSKIALEQSVLDLEEQNQELEIQYTELNNSLLDNAKRLEVERKAVSVQKELLDISKEKYQLGETSFFEYVNIYNNYIFQLSNYYNFLVKTANSKIELDQFTTLN